MEESPAKEFVERVITGSRTVRVRFCVSLPSELVAVIPTLKTPAFVGVPLIVAPELVNPPGNPEKLKLSAAGFAVAVKLKALRR
jgi:hypothetical protein